MFIFPNHYYLKGVSKNKTPAPMGIGFFKTNAFHFFGFSLYTLVKPSAEQALLEFGQWEVSCGLGPIPIKPPPQRFAFTLHKKHQFPRLPRGDHQQSIKI
jgi:hypothetical protein